MQLLQLIQGNEMADCLAKKAATDNMGILVYNKMPRETIITEGKENKITKWQEQSVNYSSNTQETECRP
jgi:hypothetical protein